MVRKEGDGCCSVQEAPPLVLIQKRVLAQAGDEEMYQNSLVLFVGSGLILLLLVRA